MILDVIEIKQKISDIVEIEKLLLEKFSATLLSSHQHEMMQLRIIDKLTSLALYYIEDGVEFGEEYFLLQRSLSDTMPQSEYFENSMESRRKNMKALSELKKANGISDNNTVQPQLITFINEVAK